MRHLLALLCGFVLDLIFGDPQWLPHPVRGMGWLISHLEPVTRRWFSKTPAGERKAGICMVILVLAASVGIAWAVLMVLGLIHPVLRWVGGAIICYQMLATKSLRVESMKVYHALEEGTLKDGRKAVSMIVGRDTENLTEAEVTAAAVETVAESTSDGIVAPMLWMAVGGPLAGVFYKAVNTMDSMVGYKNDRYLYFGWCAARLDDVVNWIPARISGVLMCLAAFFGFDGKNAWRIFRRDRRNHPSPNSAHTEAACAGALHLLLGGTHNYFGKPVYKPTIGDPDRAIERKDIVRANRLAFTTALFAMVLCDIIPMAVIFLVSGG